MSRGFRVRKWAGVISFSSLLKNHSDVSFRPTARRPRRPQGFRGSDGFTNDALYTNSETGLVAREPSGNLAPWTTVWGRLLTIRWGEGGPAKDAGRGMDLFLPKKKRYGNERGRGAG